MAICRRCIFFWNSFFLITQEIWSWHTRFTFFIPWISWIFDATTQTPQIQCCTNYKICLKVKIHLGKFLSKHICQQFSFCHIAWFNPFKRFTRHLQQVIHVQQFLVTCFVFLGTCLVACFFSISSRDTFSSSSNFTCFAVNSSSKLWHIF